jgi:ABC-type transporter Mla subunit MlaD
MATRGARNNIVAGLFVLVSLVLGVWVSFKLSDRPGMGGMRHFIVRFSLQDGATGLKRGSPVLLAGQQIGRVRSVAFATASDGVAESVDVGVEVRGDLTLYENAGVYLQLPLLGTLSSINISNVGNAQATPHMGASPAIEEGEVVVGHIAPPSFLAQAGFGSEQAAELRQSLSSMQTSLDRLAKLIETGAPKVETALADAQELLAKLKDRLAELSTRIDTMAVNIEKATGRLDPMLTKAETGIDEATAAVKDIREVVTANREKLGQILDSVNSAAGKLNQETIDQVNAALKDGREALDVFNKSLSKLSTLVTEETPGLRRTLANLRIMSDQLKLTSIEVRSQPWRILHAPTTKELSSQVLYDATRSYAEAASDLRAASEALQASGGQQSEAVIEQLRAAVEKYHAAEQALMDKLIANDRK